MIKSRLAAIGGAATLVFASVGNTAVVPFKQAVTLVQPAGDLAYSSATESPASVQATNHFQLHGDAAWTDPARFVTFSTEPTWTGLGSTSHPNSDKPATAPGAGTSLAKWSKTDAQDKPIPLYAYLLSAGQYVLEIACCLNYLSSASHSQVMVAWTTRPGFERFDCSAFFRTR